MDYTQRLGNNAVVPVVVLDEVKDAVPTAKALLTGGIDVMEITFRTAAAPEAIKSVAETCPDMLVGAGTIINLDQCKQAVDMGAKFIVSPGFDLDVVGWCVENGITVTPGCVTPTEIMAALNLGVKIVKFFPANVYGGLNAMKNLSAPFGGVKFIPTGGVNAQNIGEYTAAPFVHTVGGSWVCAKTDIAAGNFDKITSLCREAVANSLGFELAHVGINMPDSDTALKVAADYGKMFAFGVKDGNSSAFAGSGIEVMKTMFRGKNGHLAIRTNHVGRAVVYLEKNGFAADLDNAKRKGDRIVAVYLKDEVGGFAVHLLQK